MNVLRLLPIILSSLLMAAHFQRAAIPLGILLSLAVPCLLFITRPWAARLVQVLMLMAAAEWLHTLYRLVGIRLELGLPWIRLAVIIGLVALFTACSALVFQFPSNKKRYRLQAPSLDT